MKKKKRRKEWRDEEGKKEKEKKKEEGISYWVTWWEIYSPSSSQHILSIVQVLSLSLGFPLSPLALHDHIGHLHLAAWGWQAFQIIITIKVIMLHISKYSTCMHSFILTIALWDRSYYFPILEIWRLNHREVK